MCLNVFKKCLNIYFCLEQRMRIHRIEKGSFGKSSRNYSILNCFCFFFYLFIFPFSPPRLTDHYSFIGTRKISKKFTLVQKKTGNPPVLLSST
jgi:hypothetical protein